MVKHTTWMKMKQVTIGLESSGNKQHPGGKVGSVFVSS